ncbi:MAG TPA: MCE family protein [Actinomycetota bacterium]|nr:MCE family protein [Actinomycetota bacterium]
MLDKLRSSVGDARSAVGKWLRSERRLRIGQAPWIRKRAAGQWYFGRRTTINLIAFFAAAFLLIFLTATLYVIPKGGGRTIHAHFVDAGGIQPRNDVTILGVPAGCVRDAVLLPNGLVRVTADLEPGFVVTEGTKAEINRRSPIGDLTLEFIPGTGPPLPNEAVIGPRFTTPPPDAERTIETLADVLHAVPSDDLRKLVTELAVGLRGRGRDLASLSVTTADFPERLLEIKAELRSLIVNGPKVTGVLADNANAFADDLAQTAQLADILRDRRFDLVDLSRQGDRFLRVADRLLAAEKSNLACFIADMGNLNVMLAQAQLREGSLAAAIDLNRFFFGAVVQAVRFAPNDQHEWFRVFLEDATGHAKRYRRPAPDVYAGHACRSIYGPGVGPGGQPGPVWLARGSDLIRGGSGGGNGGGNGDDD